MTPPVVLGLHPTVRGFGWVVFEHIAHPIDWGLTYVRSVDKNAASLLQVRELIKRHRPEVLAVEQWRQRSTTRSARVTAFMDDVAALCAEYAISIRVYTRDDVRRALGLKPNATRHEVMEAVARYVSVFRHRKPRERRPWDGIDRRLALFCAASVAITVYFDEGGGLDNYRSTGASSGQ